MVHFKLCECKLELSEGTSSTTVIVSGKGTVCSTCKQRSSAFFPQHCSFRDIWNHLQGRRYFVLLQVLPIEFLHGLVLFSVPTDVRLTVWQI